MAISSTSEKSASTSIVPGFTFRLTEGDRVGIFTLVGRLAITHINVALFRGSEAVLRHHCHVVVDFTHAAEVLASGLGILSYARSVVEKSGRRFALVAPRDPKIFGRLPVDMPAVFSVHARLEDAVSAVLMEYGSGPSGS